MVFAGRYYNKLTVQRFRLKSTGFLGKDFQAYSLPPNPATHRPEPVLCYYCASVAIWAQTSYDQACSTRLSLVPVHVRAFTPSLSPVSPFTLSLSPVSPALSPVPVCSMQKADAGRCVASLGASGGASWYDLSVRPSLSRQRRPDLGHQMRTLPLGPGYFEVPLGPKALKISLFRPRDPAKSMDFDLKTLKIRVFAPTERSS